MTKNANGLELIHEYARDVATLWDTCVLPQLEKVPNGFYKNFRRRQIESFKLRGEPHLDYCMFSLTQGIAYNQLNLFYKKSLDFMENKYLDSFSLEPTPADIAKFSSYIQAKYSEATATIKDICEEVVANQPRIIIIPDFNS